MAEKHRDYRILYTEYYTIMKAKGHRSALISMLMKKKFLMDDH